MQDTSFEINDQGIAVNATQVASPNFDARPSGCAVDMIVIHNISLPPCEYGGDGIIELFTNCLDPKAHPYYEGIYQHEVSSHFLIRRDGDVTQFVSCEQRAWHAGVSHWQGRERCNDFSVGIELEGSDFDAFEPSQYASLNQLIQGIRNNYAIRHIVGHSDIAPGRKTDPGQHFDWQQLEHPHH